LHRQRRERLMLSMELHHTPEINRANDIDVVQQEWSFKTDRMLEKKTGCVFQAAARIEQDLLAGDHNVHTKILVVFQVVQNHPGEMMHVDNYVFYAGGAQPGERDLKQGATSDFHKGLRPILSNGP
jgi:hypothetical protein